MKNREIILVLSLIIFLFCDIVPLSVTEKFTSLNEIISNLSCEEIYLYNKGD